MNVYDFDKTIYRRDSTADFYLFCLKQKPSLCRFWPVQLFHAALFGLHLMEKTRFKESFYRFMAALPEIEAMVEVFWDMHEKDILPWYLAQHRADDVIISASPEFLLRPICRRLGIGCLMASRVDPATGRYTGVNCHGKEKVRRFREKFPKGRIDRFYSDSLSDSPLARLAREAYLVKGETMKPWPEL